AQPKHRAAFDRAMKELQEKFLALKIEERYDPFTYVWDTIEHRWPDAMREARSLTLREAAYRIVSRYFQIAGFASERNIARLVAIPPDLANGAARRLEREGKLRNEVRIANYPGRFLVLSKFL